MNTYSWCDAVPIHMIKVNFYRNLNLAFVTFFKQCRQCNIEVSICLNRWSTRFTATDKKKIKSAIVKQNKIDDENYLEPFHHSLNGGPE